jgi:peroxisomal membrane protein 4
MAKSILNLTYQHSRNLAFFVTIYKSLLLLQRKVRGDVEHSADSFIAGLIGGYMIFGTDNAVNNQIVLYLFSRVSTALARLAVKKGIIKDPNSDYTFSIFSAVIWGIDF